MRLMPARYSPIGPRRHTGRHVDCHLKTHKNDRNKKAHSSSRSRNLCAYPKQGFPLSLKRPRVRATRSGSRCYSLPAETPLHTKVFLL